ncbi:MAG: hypothetical protein KC486_36195, partial [Myxococcales bacterium]|nr:hypothetical protein [Myxococcales bacterium]
LLAEDTRERALITDAILRLVKLYRETDGADEALRDVLRRFWAAGGRRSRTGHLPYSARYLPEDLDMIGHVDVQLGLHAPLLRQLPPELPEFMTTCDDTRRAALADAWLVRRAQRRAAKENTSTQAALAAIRKEEAARRERYAERQKAREAERGEPERAPIFADSVCAVANALGMDSTATWTRAAFAASHRDPRRSAALVMLPNLAEHLAYGVQSGRLRAVDSRRYVVVDHTYEGAPVEIASFDLDELTIAPAALMPTIAEAVDRGRKTMNRDVGKLIATTPKDLAFFAVTTGEALQQMGLGEQKGGRRKLLEALLPRPEGLQIAVAAHEYLGVFMRMPTDNPVKVQLLVDLITRMLEGEEDEETAKMLRGLDLARAGDRKALLISYVAGPAELEAMMLGE